VILQLFSPLVSKALPLFEAARSPKLREVAANGEHVRILECDTTLENVLKSSHAGVRHPRCPRDGRAVIQDVGESIDLESIFAPAPGGNFGDVSVLPDHRTKIRRILAGCCFVLRRLAAIDSVK
jgi:hypothetical protein